MRNRWASAARVTTTRSTERIYHRRSVWSHQPVALLCSVWSMSLTRDKSLRAYGLQKCRGIATVRHFSQPVEPDFRSPLGKRNDHSFASRANSQAKSRNRPVRSPQSGQDDRRGRKHEGGPSGTSSHDDQVSTGFNRTASSLAGLPSLPFRASESAPFSAAPRQYHPG